MCKISGSSVDLSSFHFLSWRVLVIFSSVDFAIFQSYSSLMCSASDEMDSSCGEIGSLNLSYKSLILIVL